MRGQIRTEGVSSGLPKRIIYGTDAADECLGGSSLNTRQTNTLLASSTFVILPVLVTLWHSRTFPGQLQFLFPGTTMLVVVNLIFQIRAVRTGTASVLVMAQIMLLVLVLRVFLRPPETLWGIDSYLNLAIVSKLLAGQTWEVDALLGHPGNYPVVSFYTVEFVEITGLDIVLFAKWAPALLSLLTLVFIFLSTKHLTESTKAGLLSTLGFAITFNYVEFHSTFVSEAFAFIFISMALFAVFSSLGRSTPRPRTRQFAVSLVAMVALVLTHHLSSFVFLVFVIVLALVGKTFAARLSRSHPNPRNALKPGLGTGLALLFLVMLVGYWSFLRYTPIEIIARVASEIPGEVSFSTFAVPLRFHLARMAEASLGLGLLGVSVVGALTTRSLRTWPMITLTLAGALTGSLAVLTTQVLPYSGPGTLWGGRFLTFSYFTLWITTAAWFFRAGPRLRRVQVLLAVSLVTLVVAYGGVAAYRIPPSLYTYTENPLEIDEHRYYLLGDEDAVISWSLKHAGSLTVPDIWLRVLTSFIAQMSGSFESMSAERVYYTSDETSDALIWNSIFMQGDNECINDRTTASVVYANENSCLLLGGI